MWKEKPRRNIDVDTTSKLFWSPFSILHLHSSHSLWVSVYTNFFIQGFSWLDVTNFSYGKCYRTVQRIIYNFNFAVTLSCVTPAICFVLLFYKLIIVKRGSAALACYFDNPFDDLSWQLYLLPLQDIGQLGCVVLMTNSRQLHSAHIYTHLAGSSFNHLFSWFD